MKKGIFVGILLALAIAMPMFIGVTDCYAATPTEVVNENEIDFDGQELDADRLSTGLKAHVGQNVDFSENNKELNGDFVVLKNFTYSTYSKNAENNKEFKSGGIFNQVNGVDIKNIVIKDAVFTIDTDSATTNYFGLLASEIENSEISNVQMENITIAIVGDKKLTQINLGAIAGKAENCKIKNVEIKNLNIVDKQDALRLNTSANVGTAFGVITGNSVIENSIFEGNILLNCQSDLAENINIGGIVGYTDATKIYNSITKLTSSINVKNTSSNVCIGGYTGLNQGANVEYINNISVLFNVETNSSNKFLGSLIGKLSKNMVPDYGSIKYFKTASSVEFFGNYSEINSLYNCQGAMMTNGLSVDGFKNTAFYTNSEWDPNHYWDTDGVWEFSNLDSLPNLQAFSTYKFIFSESDSLGTLGLNKTPTYKDNDGKILPIVKPNLNGEADSLTLNYGTEFYITPQIETTNSYNKFFYITGVRHNGQTVFLISDYLDYEDKFTYVKKLIEEFTEDADKSVYLKTEDGDTTTYKKTTTESSKTITETIIVNGNTTTYISPSGLTYRRDVNEDITTYTFGTKIVTAESVTSNHGIGAVTKYSSNFNDFVYEEGANGECCFSLASIDKSCEGTYSLKLQKYKYKLDISALTGGRVMLSKEINPDKALNTITQEVEYGLTYSFTSVPNDDYGDIVDWKVKVGDVYKKFGTENSDVYKNSNTLSFTFDENSDLGFVDIVGKNNSDKVITNELGMTIELEFSNNIQIVRFKYVINNKNADKEVYDNAKLYISGTLLKADNGNIETKRNIGGKYILSVIVPQGYQFSQWKINDSSSTYTTPDYCEINITDDGELLITIELKQEEINTETNLTWLYITLGSIGGIGLVMLVVFIIIKKRKDNSYKKMLY